MGDESLLRNQYFRWVIFSIYVGSIYSTLYIIRKVQGALVDLFGEATYYPIYLIILGAGVFLAIHIYRNFQSMGFKAVVAMFLLAMAYIAGFCILDVQVERVHLVEYGFLSLLTVWVLYPKYKSATVYIGAVIITYLVGIGDETIQWLLPNRVGEWRDLILNGVSGSLPVFGLAFIWKPPSISQSIKKAELHTVAILEGIAIFATALFMLSVHDYGKPLTLDLAWTPSLLTQEFVDSVTLEKLTADLGDDPLIKGYLKEAREHYGMSQLYKDQKRSRDAAFEVYLTRGLYGPGLEAQGLAFLPEEITLADSLSPLDKQRYKSKYKGEIIVGISPWHIWIIWFILQGGNLILIRSTRSKNKLQRANRG